MKKTATTAYGFTDLLRDPQLLGPSFTQASRRSWLLCASTIFAEPLSDVTDADQALIDACIGGRPAPTSPVQEAFLIIGRRGGKSSLAAALAIYATCCRVYQLAAGERGLFVIVAGDRRQARVVKRYVSGLMRTAPMLERLIANETSERIELTNGLDIEIMAATVRAVRGHTIVGAVCDEVAFWPTDESANPDTEVLAALRPAMATIPGALLLMISSPYARRGEIYTAYRDHFGRDGDTLVWQAATRTMNPTVPQDTVDRAYADDPARASAEYGAQFRRDVETFLSREALEAVVVPGQRELPFRVGVRYSGFLDFAGGAPGGDSAVLAIAHTEKRADRTIAVLDLVREQRPPFSPEQVCETFATTLKAYGLHHATADRYAGQFPVEAMSKHLVSVAPSEKSKSELYHELLPLVQSGGCELLDDTRLLAQLGTLERRTARGGKDSIDHAPGAHDDLANGAAGALHRAWRAGRFVSETSTAGGGGLPRLIF